MVPDDHVELPAALVQAVAVAVQSHPALRTSSRLAERCGISRMSLWRAWRAAFPDPETSVNDLIRGVCLQRLALLEAGGLPRTHAERLLGIDRRTVTAWEQRFARQGERGAAARLRLPELVTLSAGDCYEYALVGGSALANHSSGVRTKRAPSRISFSCHNPSLDTSPS